MRIEPINFRDFATEGQISVLGRKHHLPGGRRKEEAPPPPPAPTFSEEQLKAAERESYKKGFVDGTKEGHQQAQTEQADVDRKLAETVEQFTTTLTPLLADYKQMILQLRQDLPKVALTIAKKAAGDALNENASAAIEHMALTCAQTMIGEPKIAITVHANLAATLEKKLQELKAKSGSATDFIITPSDTIALADCRVEWKHGAMERHTGQLWQEIEKAVASMSAAAVRDTEKQIEPLAEQLPQATTDNHKKE